MAIAPEVADIVGVMESKGFAVFENPGGHDLNIVGIRTRENVANSFNDWATVFYRFDGVWNFFAFPATTDPGTFYRSNPINVKGTAIMKPGQYRGAYMIGKHKNYKALQQKGDITVFRDDNRDDRYDTTGLPEESGVFAINIHHANAHRASTVVGKWSAGCQVLQDPDQFAFLLMLCERARSKFSNSFTYTLVTEDDFD